MKNIAVVCLCLLFCLWADANPVVVDSNKLKAFFDYIQQSRSFDSKRKFSPKVVAATVPCVQNELTEGNPETAALFASFIDVAEKCANLSAADPNSKTAFDSCVKSEFVVSTDEEDEQMNQVGKILMKCFMKTAMAFLLNDRTPFAEK